jgi:truncated hemoglobin YjbI
VYSLLLYIGQYFHRASRMRLQKRHLTLAEKEKKLSAAETADEKTPAPAEEAGGPEEKKGSAVSRLFRKFL